MNCFAELPTLPVAAGPRQRQKSQSSILPVPLTTATNDSLHRILQALAGPDCSLYRPPRRRPHHRPHWRH